MSTTEAATDHTSSSIPAAVPLKQTPLASWHERHGAKMVDFAGWLMPLQYGKVLEEHHSVRQSAGLFDIGHMGLVIASSGNIQNTREFLQSMVPQNLNVLYPGKAVYTQLLNESGGILDDIIIYMLPEACVLEGFSEFLIICNASNTDADLQWLNTHKRSDITLTRQENHTLFALQGPSFSNVLGNCGISESQLPKRFHLAEASFQTSESAITVMLCRTGYTGEDGVEIIAPKQQAEKIWQTLIDQGKTLNLSPVGLAARDTLRLEAAYPLHGHDITPETTPLEAGLGWSVKLDQAGDFMGKAALSAQKEKGLARKFYCFKLLKKTIARQHDRIFMDGQPVGEVTSGSISPTLNEPIAMGYINDTTLNPGVIIQLEVRGRQIDAEIVKRPFYTAR